MENQEQAVVKLSHKFGKCKLGALHRFQKEAQKIKDAWTADLLALQVKIDEMGLQKSNMALFKTKTARDATKIEAEAREVLKIIDSDYKVELHRLVMQFGGDVVDHKVTFPDGSESSLPKHLFLQDEQLAALLK